MESDSIPPPSLQFGLDHAASSDRLVLIAPEHACRRSAMLARIYSLSHVFTIAEAKTQYCDYHRLLIHKPNA